MVRKPNNGKRGNFHLELLPALRARDEALDKQRHESWWKAYAIRSGVEATMSELKRAHGMGRLRVRRKPRVEFAVSRKVTACNIKRWLRTVAGRLKARRRPLGVPGALGAIWRAITPLRRLWKRLRRKMGKSAAIARLTVSAAGRNG